MKKNVAVTKQKMKQDNQDIDNNERVKKLLVVLEKTNDLGFHLDIL